MPPQSLLAAPAPQIPASPRTVPVSRRGVPDRLLDLAWLYWLGCAVFALLLALTTTLTPHRIWGACAALGYVVAAGLARRARRPWDRRAAWAAVAGAVVLPLLVLIAVGGAQSEVHVVEDSGRLLLHSGSPYLPHPTDVDGYNPYLPGMALFGLPRALLGATPLADARLWFAAVFLTSMVVAARRTTGTGRTRASGAGGCPGRPADSALLLAAFPAVALPLAVGGVDLPVIGLMCLGLALAGRGGSGTAAGCAMGAAAALKWTAWPLLPVGLVLLAVTAGRRAAIRAAVVAVLISVLAVVPAFLANPRAFVEQVVLYPLGQGGVRSPAASPLPGHLLATYVPGGHALAVIALAVAALAICVSLVVRPPRTVLAAADRLALGLGLAMCLIPATRFGYLAYPLVLAVWFRRVPVRPADGADQNLLRRPWLVRGS